MPALEFPLAQGWTRGLTLGFESSQETLNYDWAQTLHVKQVHGDQVILLSSAARPGLVGEADGLCCDGEWLKENQFRLAIKSADCLPMFFIETQQKKICAIHAGWRGLAQKIHLWPFQNGDFDPTKTWVWVGPSLNGFDFEVQHDMISKFDLLTQADGSIFQKQNSKSYFFPWNLIARDYLKLKVELLYNVETNTYSDNQWGSYRRYCHQKKDTNSSEVYRQNLSWIGATI
jgi:copper oxidase (laccase) domain-containing protein